VTVEETSEAAVVGTVTSSALKSVPHARPSADDRPDRVSRGKPLGHRDGVPVYASGQAPAYLRTKSGLRRERRKPAVDQQPGAYIYTRWYGDLVALYDPAEAVKMRPLGSAVKKSMEARRTCPECGEIRQHIVRDGQCSICRLRAEETKRRRLARTCARCRTERRTPYPPGKPRMCRGCRRAEAAERRAAEERCMRDATTCWSCRHRDCITVTATEEEVRQTWAERRHWHPRLCPLCDERIERQQAEERKRREDAERAEREARKRHVEELRDWAREVLADERTVILDTETTGLHDSARIVEISVITGTGQIVLNTLLNPGEPIPEDASYIHGISDQDVADAPTFSDILVTLTAALDYKRVVIYNAPYDTGRLRHELRLHYAGRRANPQEEADAWLGAMNFEDAMIPYSDWVGDWNDYFGNYAWQPLNGGHRALGDCRAVIDCLRAMAGEPQSPILASAAQAPLWSEGEQPA
jgi:hypothetical protein